MAVPIIPGQTFSWGARRKVAQGPYAHPSWDTQYDVAADGRLLVMKTLSTPPPNEIVVVMNWFEDLKRLVPSR